MLILEEEFRIYVGSKRNELRTKSDKRIYTEYTGINKWFEKIYLNC